MPRKDQIPKGKVQLVVYVSKDIYNLLIEVAPKIYGKQRGGMSYVVEEALKQFLFGEKRKKSEKSGSVHKHKITRVDVREVYDLVVQKIMEIDNLSYKPREISEKILDQAIMGVRGVSEPTVRNWKKRFELFGLIKYVRGSPQKRIFQLS